MLSWERNRVASTLRLSTPAKKSHQSVNSRDRLKDSCSRRPVHLDEACRRKQKYSPSKTVYALVANSNDRGSIGD
jgi:hypothetical protein